MPNFNGPPPAYMSRLSAGRNLRGIVMVFAFMGAIYSLFSAIGNFRSIGIDRQEHENKLATFSLVMGILYIVVFAFEAFGIAATITQRHQLVRIYALLSLVTVLIALGGGLLEIVVHFTMKDSIINECTSLVKGDDVVYYPFGWFGPVRHDFLSESEANSWCRSQWDHDSWADIVGLLIVIFLSAMFSMFTWAYYRQLLDPTSAANVIRTPGPRGPTSFPSHYNPAFDASVPSLGYQYGPGQPYPQQPYPQFAPPPGPPPAMKGADSKHDEPTYGYDIDDKAKENPFADFDEPVHKASGSH